MAHDHTHCNEAIPSPAVGIAIDPVCSMSVKMEGAAHVADYDGATHYFCSGGCKTKFLANPEQYLSGAYLDAAEDPPEGTIYTRSEEHTSELQSLMRISYAVFCLKKKKITRNYQNSDTTYT